MASENIFSVQNHFRQVLEPVGQVVLAGGAVRDYWRQVIPKDFDVFVLPWAPTEGFHTDNVRKSMVRELLKDYEKNQPILAHDYEPYLVADLNWHEVRVQVMLNPAPDPIKLVDTFDWQICQYYWNGSELYGRDNPIETVKPGAELKLNKVRFPASTLRRGYRFSERFQMVLPNETILKLCQMVVERGMYAGPEGAVPDMPSLEANTLVD